MKKIVYLLCVVAWLLLPGLCAMAQDANQPNTAIGSDLKSRPNAEKVWSLQECISAAMTNQADVLTAQNNVAIARSRSSQAKSSYFPQLTLQNNAFRWGSEGVLNKVTTGTALSVSQNVFDGGLREANTKGARYGVAQNRAGLTRTRQTVTFNVTSAYFELLRARHLAEVAQKNVDYNEELRKQVQARADEGTAARIDVLPVESQLANAHLNKLTANNNVRIAALNLQIAMGVTPAYGFDVQDVEGVPSVEVAELGSYISSADGGRPDIEQSLANLGAAQASLRAARLGLYPRIVVSGEYQRQVQGGFTTSGAQLVGGLVFDIFNGNANRAAYNQAKAERANADLQQKQIIKNIRAEVEEAYLNLTSAKDRVSASQLSLDAAQKNYDAQTERYKTGFGIPLDLLNAEVQVVSAQNNMVQARYDYFIYIAQMNYMVGK